MAVVCAALCAVRPGESTAPPRDGVGCGPADAAGLTSQEIRLWEGHGLGRPADHLLGQTSEREAGETTVLRVVVILVDFPDLPADRILHTPEYYENLLFSRGVRPGGSVADYLDVSSRGRFQLEGEVRGWFTVPQTRNSYTGGVSGLGSYPVNSQRLAEEAIYLADPAINFADYDTEGPDDVPDSGDDDEIVDGLVLVHAGTGRGEGGTTPNDFVSVHWWTPEPVPADGVYGRFFTLNPENGEIGIFIHEIGHLLGLPDLYDTDGGSAGIGQWSMMSGGWTLDGARTPADFDAWSKVQLGFADVKRIFLNREGEVILPTASSGQVYRLWANGGGTQEYYLLENRRRTGLDARLPGEGLLLYHVDERVPNNRNPNHFHVALEQADGLYQLENRYGSVSFGDSGDPYVQGREFGRDTDPSSFAYDGTESYVALFDVHGPDPAGAYTANIHVEPGAVVTVTDLQSTEVSGNGDGMIVTGETAGLLPRVTVTRKQTANLVLSLRSLDPRAQVLDTTWTPGTVLPGQQVTPPQPLRVQVVGALPTNPYGLRLELTATWDDEPRKTVPVELGLGTVVGLSADFNASQSPWTHAPLRVTAVNQWLYGPTFGVGATPGFKYGSVPYGFLGGADAALVSPPILLPPHAILQFDQAVDITYPDTTTMLGGGVIEVSANGGDWQPVTPDGGYPEYYGGASPEWLGRPVFAGRPKSGTYHSVRASLGGFVGTVRVRFRFFAEKATTSGTGWRVDNVRVLTDPTPVRVLAASATADGGDVLLNWELADPLPAFLRWRRGRDEPGAIAVSDWLPARASGALRDAGAATLGPIRYWLDGLERDGHVETWGPVDFAEGAPLLAWSVLENPFRGSARFAWPRALDVDERLEIYDVRGRRVALVGVPLGSSRLDWDGRAQDGRPVPAGVYFARLRGASFPPLRLVRLP
jgi:immune inhibitor A